MAANAGRMDLRPAEEELLDFRKRFDDLIAYEQFVLEERKTLQQQVDRLKEEQRTRQLEETIDPDVRAFEESFAASDNTQGRLLLVALVFFLLGWHFDTSALPWR